MEQVSLISSCRWEGGSVKCLVTLQNGAVYLGRALTEPLLEL